MSDPKTTKIFSKLTTLWRLLTEKSPELRQAFTNYHMVRRKYVLSRTSEHFGKNKFEPAPLLNLTLLDIGCGTNKIAQELALRGAECTCIDPDAQVLKKAKKGAQTYGTPIQFIQATAEEMVKEPQSYDIILLLDVLGYGKDSQHMLWAMKKILKPNGIIILSSMNKTFTSFLYHKVLAEWILKWVPKGTYNNHAFIGPTKLTEMLKKQGLEFSQIVGVHFNTQNKEWLKTTDLSIRYLGVLKHIEQDRGMQHSESE